MTRNTFLFPTTEKRCAPWAQCAHKTPCITYHIFGFFGRVKIYKLFPVFMAFLTKTLYSIWKNYAFLLNFRGDFSVLERQTAQNGVQGFTNMQKMELPYRRRGGRGEKRGRTANAAARPEGREKREERRMKRKCVPSGRLNLFGRGIISPSGG